nr:MAG TPA: hypothetical protein [Caudoviricetes sp.]
MVDIVNMDYDELCELADTLSDMLVLAKRYDFEAVDTAALLELSVAVDVRLTEIEMDEEAAMNREYEKEAL